MTGQGIYSNNFSKVFSQLLKKSGTTCYRINKYTGVDQGYLSRLRNGKQHNPSFKLVFKISLALTHFSDKITINDIQQLLHSAIYPLVLDDDY